MAGRHHGIAIMVFISLCSCMEDLEVSGDDRVPMMEQPVFKRSGKRKKKMAKVKGWMEKRKC